jgi:hypothetical protein
MSRLLSVALLASLSLAACGTTTRFVPTNPSPHPLAAREPLEVDVYTTGAPNVAYVEVGIIQTRQSSDLSTKDMPGIISDMRKQAGKIGCDAVIINGAADKHESSTVISDESYSSSNSTLEGFWGACIVYLSPQETPAATAAAE